MMPDLFHWLLTGVKCNEMTEASTSQFYNPVKGDWARPSCWRSSACPREFSGRSRSRARGLGRCGRIWPPRPGLARRKVVLPGSHDTASAVMAVPADSRPGERPDWCYISLGTWALMGIESPQPVVNDQVLKLNFTNEGGVGGTTRLLKNITGLWLVQECRRVWNQAGEKLGLGGSEPSSAAAQPPLGSFINPDAPDSSPPATCPRPSARSAERPARPCPATKGAVLRCALESMAMKFRQVLGMCEELAGGRIETIHIVGGGTQNRQLCQVAADACGRRVVAGPVEATAIGNVMMQAVAAGDVASIAEAREVIRRSFPVEEYEPQEHGRLGRGVRAVLENFVMKRMKRRRS